MIKKLKEGHWPIFFLSSFSSMANLFLPIILTRILAPSEIGLYKIYFLHFNALPFFFMTGGPINSVYYWIGKNKEMRFKYLQQSFILGLILSGLILVIGLPLIYPVSEYIQLRPEYVAILLFSAFFSVPAAFVEETKIAMGETLKGSLYSTFFEILKILAFILLAYYLKDIGNLFLSYAIILGTKFIITLIWGLRSKIILFEFNKNILKEIFAYCLPVSMAGLVSFFLDKIDQFVMASQLAVDDFAFYSMGCLMIPPLYLLEMSVTKVLIPKISESNTNNDNKAIYHFRKAISDTSFILIPAFFGLFYFAEPITKLLYTEKFIDAAKYLKIFSISYLFLLIPYDAIPRAVGRTKWIFKITLAIAPFSFIAILLTSKYSTAEYVLGVSLLFKLISRLATLIYSCKIMDWKIRSVFPWTKIIFFASFSFILTMISHLVHPMFNNDIQWFLVCSPIFAITYLGLLYIPFKKGYFHD